MRLLAALATAVAVYLLGAVATGRAPQLRRRRTGSGGQRAARRRQWLLQAGADTTPGRFTAACLTLGGGVALAVTAVTDTPVVAVVPAVSAALLPRMALARRRTRRQRAVQEAWPDGLREMHAAIAAGMSLPQAVIALAENGPAALQLAFARFPALLRTVGMVTALEIVKAEVADPTTDRVVEILILAHERGGRIVSDILRDLADATAQDVHTLEQIATDALEQKINARAVFVLPWLVLLTLTAKPGPFRDFYQSPSGLGVVAVAALLSLAGAAIADRLARDPLESRVLAGRRRAAR
ncbi:MAG: type II secretion system F family protein [Actinomycetota bacterium]|jgi:tight adherence protein B|nr:type II secretion system F family protein [Euzebyaceae bacterium]MDQ3453133.1 type II secretion system F family protein [Actinomycetota bacterium]